MLIRIYWNDLFNGTLLIYEIDLKKEYNRKYKEI